MSKNQNNSLLEVHRSWEDWAGLGLGLLVLFSPWIVEQSSQSLAVRSAVVTGIVLVLVAGLEMTRLYRWHEVVTLLAGAWLFVSPFVLGYSSVQPLATWHLALGAFITLLSALEIWQDWGLSDDDLAAHG
jgi:SPW repeat